MAFKVILVIFLLTLSGISTATSEEKVLSARGVSCNVMGNMGCYVHCVRLGHRRGGRCNAAKSCICHV
ncbi:Hypothetical predicted protein [Octopus vulgaris]|uniref:Invertebrate defensins family profile domain-containing protein n=1 Tax=Octopus vulgaris TaxID=6645 RepID=A0AA36C1M2_OCTVU|nr:Hypothetical predicted protein [Octopus vulgaris]